MEQSLHYWLAQLHENAPGTIGDMLHYTVASCDAENGDYVMYVDTEPWMRNAFGSLHGGIISTAMDQGMGMLATCLMDGKALTPTIQLNLTFHHPLLATNRMLLKIHVEAHTRTMLHLRAEARNEQEPDKLCASATGIFYIKYVDR